MQETSRIVERYVDQRFAELHNLLREIENNVTSVDSRLTNVVEHYLSYKDLWREWWKVVAVLIAAISAGAGIAIAGAQWIR